MLYIKTHTCPFPQHIKPESLAASIYNRGVKGLEQHLTTPHPALNLSLPPCGLKNNGTALPISQPVAVATPSHLGMENGPEEEGGKTP